MTEVARFFDSQSYGESDQAEVTARMVRDGVVGGAGNQLSVISGGVGFASVATGEAFVQGFWYKNTAPKTLAITANLSGTLRIDLVVLRLDRTGNTLLTVIKDGVVGSGTPALTQVVGGVWELPLAQISTISGASTYIDMRTIQSPVYNPMNTAQDLVVGGAGGVPARMPVGAASRVFGVNSGGVLGYYPVTTDMVADGTLVNADLAAQTLRGGVDGATSRFVPGSINTQDIQDRGIAGTDLAVGAVTSTEIADGSIVGGDIANNSVHPSKLTSWSGGTYGNHVLYDVPGGGGISVAQVQDSLCAVNSINANKLMSGTIGTAQMGDEVITVAKIAQRNVTNYGFLPFSNAARVGAGSWVYFGGGIAIGGTNGQTVVQFTVVCSLNPDYVNALIYLGVAVDTVASPSWTTYATCSLANQVLHYSITIEHLMTAATHTYYPLMLTNAGTMVLYGSAYSSIMAYYR